MKEKIMAYEAPISTALEVHSEGVVCGSPKYGTAGSAGGDAGLNDDNFNYGGF